MSSTITNFVSKGLDRVEAGQPVVLLLHGYAADEKDLPELMGFLPDLPWAALRAPIALGHEQQVPQVGSQDNRLLPTLPH